MKTFKNVLALFITGSLYAHGSVPTSSEFTSSELTGCDSITLLSADDIRNTTLVNTLNAIDISDLSGTPDRNCPAVKYFIVTSLPMSNQGVLYMADGTTPVTVNQQLTVAEAEGLKFDPKLGFIGDATFTYKVEDLVGTISNNQGTVTIPVTYAVSANPIADDKTYARAMSNHWGPTEIPNLSGKDATGNAVHEFQIKSLPTAAQGVLYMADGVTRVTLNQTLTQDEADGLKFDPKAGFVGNAIFTYVSIDGNGRKSMAARVTLPVANSVGGGVNLPTADDKTYARAMSNHWGPTEIPNLSGKDATGNAVHEFQIKSLPTAAQGVLYMADGVTRVTLNQTLTQDEADGLKFDPKAGFVGNAIFTYVSIDGNGRKSRPATVTMPVANSAGGGAVIKPITDDRLNPKLLNNLGATNITDLSGTDKDGNAVTKFIIKELPNANEGVLYMADGVTAVRVNQELTLEEANGLKFDPKAGFVGDATFKYVAVDNAGVEGNSASVTIPVGNTIDNSDKKPTSDDKTNGRLNNTLGATNITDLSGTDKDGNAVTKFIITELPNVEEGVLYMADGVTPVRVNQELTLEEANGLKFDPKAGFVGGATFRYAAIDNRGLQGEDATVTIPVSNPAGGGGGAVVKPITYNRVSPKMLNSLGATDITGLLGTDKDGNIVTKFIIKTLPNANEGILYMADGVTPVRLNQELTREEANGLKFDPKAGFVGDATFRYAAIDDAGVVGNSATVTIPVESAGNVKPISADKRNGRLDNTLGATDITDLSGTDKDGHAVTKFIITKLPNANEGILYMADGVTPVRLNQELTQEEANGLKFDPKEGFVGDATFNYAPVDKDGVQGDDATITIPVGNPNGGGEAVKPITDDRQNPKMLNNLGATDITDLSGTDKDGQAVTKFIITKLPNADEGVLYMADGVTPVRVNQELTLEEANGLKFDPKAGFVGDATFEYAAIDNDGVRGNDATVTIPVGNHIDENDKKPTSDDKTNGRLDNTLGATDITNFSGTDKDGHAVTKFIITKLPNANEGILYMADGVTPVTLNQELTLEEANGLKFDPKEGFVGDATFEYVAIDKDGVRSNKATVTIPVGNPIGGNVVAYDDIGQAEGGANPIHINVLANDRAVPAGAVVRLVDQNGAFTDRLVVEGQGVWTVDGNNIVTFTPAAGFVGTPTPIQYVIQQGTNSRLISNRATISIAGQCVCEPYESSVASLGSFGLIIMLFLSSLLGLNLARKEIN